MKIIIDARGIAVGRLGSFIAKELLKGKQVDVINSEQAIISGNKQDIVNRLKNWRKKGSSSQKGPKVSRLPHLFLKRMIRGMLPWDRAKGQEAHKKLMCYVGNGNLKEEEIKQAKILDFKKPLKYISIKEIIKLL